MKKICSFVGPLLLALSVAAFFLGVVCGCEVIGAVFDSCGVWSPQTEATMKFYAGLGTCFALAGYAFLRLGEIVLPVTLSEFLPEVD